MKILYLTQILPFPEDSGGRIKTYQTLRLLAKNHQVYLVCFVTSKNDFKYRKNLEKFCHQVKAFYNPIITSRFKKIPKILFSSLFSFLPFEVYRYFDSQMKLYIDRIAEREKFDAIHIDHINMSQYLPLEKNCLWVLEEHNIESEAALEIFKKERSLFRLFYFWEFIKFWFFEKKILAKFDHILAISQEDKLTLINRGINKDKVTALPVSMQVKELYKSQEEKNLLFLGYLSWWPNKDGFFWFADKVWPKIKKEIPKIKLSIIGQGANEKMRRIDEENEDVVLLGYVDNLTAHLSKTSVLIVPLRMGGGIRIKILTGLATGIPIVTTTIGTRGISVKKEREVLLADNPSEFAQAVIKVLRNEKLANQLSCQGLEFIKKNYSQQEAKKALSKVYG